MITMENTRELIDFEYYGKSYRMAPDEIEAAYRYQEMQYRKADALRMLTSYAFGNCMTADSMWEQTTLFAPPPITGTPAISLFDNTTHSSEQPSEWMKRLVPDGEYVVMVGTHPLVMRKTKLAVDEVPEGHQFYHYLIDGAVYAGIFVGKENAE